MAVLNLRRVREAVPYIDRLKTGQKVKIVAQSIATGASSDTSAAAGLEDIRREIDELYRTGEYGACIGLIDQNMRALYEKERWPEVFFEVLRVYQRAYPFLKRTEKLEDRLFALLKENGVPHVMAQLLRLSDGSISWNVDYFKNLALQSERGEDAGSAISFCDICLKLDPANSGVYAVRGRLLDDMELHDEAAGMFQKAVELNDQNHSAWHSLAKHTSQTDPAEALTQVEKALVLADAEAVYYSTKAKLLQRLKEPDIDGALECCDKAMELAPHEAVYPYEKAEILMQQGKDVAAVALYRKAVGLDEKHLPTLWRLARFYAESQPDMALSYINTILSQEQGGDGRSEASLIKGTLLMRLGETAAALDEFKQLMGVDPQCHEALAGFATVLLDEDPATALSYFDRAIAISGKNASYHAGRARALERLDDVAGAIKAYRAAVALDKTDSRAYGRLAALLAPTKPAEALGFYDSAIACMPESAYYHAAKADLLMTLNRREQAFACYMSAAELDPNNPKYHITVAEFLAEAGNSASAAEHYRQAAALDPNNAETFYRLAGLLQTSEPDAALLHINGAISLDGANGGYYFLKSKILTALGHDKQALQALSDTLKADGKNDEALSEISALLREESPELSLHYLNRAIELSPPNSKNRSEYITSRADMFFSTGKTREALAQYAEAASLDRENAKAELGAARCLDALVDGRALSHYEKSVKLAPDNAECHGHMAACLVRLGRDSEALACYNEAMRLDGESPAYMRGKADILERLGDKKEAVGLYRVLLEKLRDDEHAVARLGFLLSENAEHRDALFYLDRAVEMNPREPKYRLWRGACLLALGDAAAAAREYTQAASLSGGDPEIYYSLAGLTLEFAPETALGHCKKALMADDKNPKYLILYGRIQLALENADTALDCFNAAAALDPKSHEAKERAARLLAGRGDPLALEALDSALKTDPNCPDCLFEKAKLLDAQNADAGVLIELLDRALKTKPDFTPARALLVEQLKKKRSFIRLAIENRKLKGN